MTKQGPVTGISCETTQGTHVSCARASQRLRAGVALCELLRACRGMRARVRACVRARVRACACASARVCARV
eukprot:6188848-Pleurochrysis_carterae.AAC.1